MIKRNYAYLAATLVSIIYGVTFTVAKDVMPKFVLPFGFILLRVAGSAALFWAYVEVLAHKTSAAVASKCTGNFDFVFIETSCVE